ncbi:hypothetical protein [Nioella aestuarii]|uniref:hypothetical protein n=1 Tax=Nioella aestuarii TaxID=1662864 RepID=UPI003D7F4DA3
MPLHILIILVVGGIGLIALLTHFLGLSRALRLTSADEARTAWLRGWPEDTVTAAHIAPDGSAALVETDHGLGIVFVLGADSCAHRLDGSDIHETPGGLRILFHDFATPRLDVALDPEALTHWRQILSEKR